MRKLILIFMVTSLPLAAFAENFAKVIQMRGKVSQLAPGMHNAEWVKKGQGLREESSILTRKKSFVKIRILEDGSTVTLGPNSKLSLAKIKKKEGSIVNMIHGALRAKVVKGNKKAKKAKMYVKTPNAVMGVRGTEFVTVVNEQNKVASLITLEGEVAMAKTEALPSEDLQKVVEEAVDQKPDVKVVKKGEASTAYAHKRDVTPPAKVNPVQLVALKQNENLEQSEAPEASDNIEIDEQTKKNLYASNSTETPKNGAVVDLSSGIFIPEVEDDDMDVGKVDAKTGQYVPSKDVKVDPVKGFVAMADTEESKEKAKKLNSIVEYREVSRDFAPGHAVTSESYDPGESHYFWSFGLGPQNYQIENRAKDSSDFVGLNLHMNVGQSRPVDARFSWHWMLGMNALGLDRGDYDHEDKNASFDDEEDPVAFSLLLGWQYLLAPDFALSMDFGLEQEQFPVFRTGFGANSLDSAVFVSAATFVRVGLGLEKRFSSRKSMKFNFIHYGNNRDDKFTIREGHGLGLDWKVISQSNQDKFYKISARLKEFEQASMTIRQRQLLFSMGYLF